jgi:hypothetical protein
MAHQNMMTTREVWAVLELIAIYAVILTPLGVIGPIDRLVLSSQG